MTITLQNTLTTASERHADATASSAVKERPILMSAAMVLACLDDSKTQTRRVLRPQWPRANTEPKEHSCSPGLWIAYTSDGRLRNGEGESGGERRCPYGTPGDRLWVRESFRIVPTSAYRASEGVQQTVCPTDPYEAAIYRAGWDRGGSGVWKPSIHMPRWASRLTLIITEVRVELLQDITEADARAEGVASVAAYRELWDSLNAKRGYGWDMNPFVWVVSFVRVQP